ncbi:hypothetical protein PHLCEN_2v13450 [Hermanssonia centrifuga]|uniref:Uncharacterized protein n=1 Tax=Hermanssonia centrifuga TaxID=98765 RepID=A0A2R6NE74_9APHY|nr:hypothetical protein PHLCEN_2v13450 [Hermanssonia centrifuga]
MSRCKPASRSELPREDLREEGADAARAAVGTRRLEYECGSEACEWRYGDKGFSREGVRRCDEREPGITNSRSGSALSDENIAGRELLNMLSVGNVAIEDGEAVVGEVVICVPYLGECME